MKERDLRILCILYDEFSKFPFLSINLILEELVKRVTASCLSITTNY